MLKVYGFARVNAGARGNTRDLRVLWALEEMGMPYEIVGIDHPNHDLDTSAYREKNPFGQIPFIDDDGVIVSESGATLLYLARKSGKLMPEDLAGEAQVLPKPSIRGHRRVHGRRPPHDARASSAAARTGACWRRTRTCSPTSSAARSDPRGSGWKRTSRASGPPEPANLRAP